MLLNHIDELIYEDGHSLIFDGETYPRRALRFINGYIERDGNNKSIIDEITNSNLDDCTKKKLKDLFESDRMIFPQFTKNMEFDTILCSLCMYGLLPQSVLYKDLLEGWELYIGIGKIKADKMIKNGYLFPEIKEMRTLTLLSKVSYDMHLTFIKLISEYSSKLELVGSLSRCKKSNCIRFAHDIDYISKYIYKNEITDFMNSEYTKLTPTSWLVVINNRLVRVDITFYEDSYYVPFKIHYTGPTSKNIKYRNAAIKLGMSLSQYGLKRNGEIIHIENEDELMTHLNI